ncbi:MAG TPA: hypothetical protein VG944_20840 [Fimbriimonas sp.]|nr:hypothetical protein [Fimbriimonas sp.]
MLLNEWAPPQSSKLAWIERGLKWRQLVYDVNEITNKTAQRPKFGSNAKELMSGNPNGKPICRQFHAVLFVLIAKPSNSDAI